MSEIKKKFISGYKKGIPQLLKKNLIADVETPISSLLKVAKKEKYSFLLESVEGGSKRGRYSILGCDPDLIWNVDSGKTKVKYIDCKYDYKLNSHPLKSLRELINLSKFKNSNNDVPYPTLVGYLGYPIIQFMENLKLINKDNIKIPDATLIRPKIVAVFDNIKDTISLMTVKYPSKKKSPENAYDEANLLLKKTVKKLEKSILNSSIAKNKNTKLNFTSNFKKEEFYKVVKKAKKYIQEGDIFQVVPSQRFETKYSLKAIDLYRSLRRLNPSPYLVNLNFDKFGIVASSPELMVQLRNNKVTIRPIAGTRRRGKNVSEDIVLSKDLLSDKKELAEHLMLLDLGRNDVGRVSKKGSVKVTEKMIIEYYSHVMHIVSNVEGTINNKLDAIDALTAGFPAGTVTGAPKIRAMEIIEELENLNRSFYAGCMGYFDSNGDMDTCISLRTGLVKKNKLYIQAGAGIVHDSIPKNEHLEILNKAGALMAAAQDSYRYK
ncbi:MAG: anthranilate synthase component I [Pelagibacteraceae bacterium]|nr:anthranilate synthase component I [Pelagibacteraceae bacterium]|tara:strand:- start:93 stop:1568 length:1476 start_codon:yes stop_codon:yes gene_type:complete